MQPLFLQQWLSDEILKALSWTFVHSLWQGLIAAIAAAIIILCTRKSTARLRYNLLGMVVIFFLVATVFTFSQQLKNGTVAEKSVTPFTAYDAETAVVAYDIDTTPASSVSVTKELVGFLNGNADLFVLIWGVFFLVNCMKLITGIAGVYRIRQYKIHPVSEEWRMKLIQLSKSIGVRQSVRLLQSELVKVPVAIGLFKPVILVPLGLLSHLPPDQVETILLHELAHIRRKDYLLNILQRFTEAVFFFNPALLWISSLIRQEREACCDDIVVANTNHKGNYLEALISFHEYSQASPGYAMAISTKRHYLLNRVRRMVTRENKKLNLMEKIFLLIGVATVTAFTFIPQKENIAKKNQAVVEPVKTSAEPVTVQTSGKSKPVPVIALKSFGKKVMKEPVLEITVDSPDIDTVPGRMKKERDAETGKENENENVKETSKYKSLSSDINDDGKTRRETTTAVGEDGKRYTYTKLNGKVTSLIVDGKTIPENEYGNYDELFSTIERAREERRRIKDEKMKLKTDQMRLKQEHLRFESQDKMKLKSDKLMFDKERDKASLFEKMSRDQDKKMKDLIKRQEEIKSKFHEQQSINRKEFDQKMDKIRKEREKDDKQKDLHRKEFDKKMDELRKDRDKENEKLQKEKEKMTREFEKDKSEGRNKNQLFRSGGRVTVPRINGREVIKNDTKEIDNDGVKTVEGNIGKISTDANESKKSEKKERFDYALNLTKVSKLELTKSFDFTPTTIKNIDFKIKTASVSFEPKTMHKAYEPKRIEYKPYEPKHVPKPPAPPTIQPKKMKEQVVT
jgi:beta-lactamase regulating signal transducer with metallopeptidase domain